MENKSKNSVEQTFENKLNILALNADQGACGWMRVRSPFKEIKKQKLANVAILEGQQTEKTVKAAVAKSDILLVKPGGQKALEFAKQLYPQKKVVVDFDDDMFKVHFTSEHYRSYGTQDVALKQKDGTVREMWITGSTPGYSRFDNQHRLLELKQMLEEADLVTVVTEELGKAIAELLHPMKQNIVVIPNSVDWRLYPDVEVKDKSKKKGVVRMGWCGGASHGGDLSSVASGIKRLVKDNKKLEYHQIGQQYPFLNELGSALHKHDWIAFEANPFRMKMLDLDFLIAPLEDIPFNRHKDPLKFWDAAALRVPLLAQNMSPFSKVIEDGKTGMLFSDTKEFIEKARKLIDNPKLREKVANNAYEMVKEHRSLDKWAPKIVDLYEQVVNDFEPTK